MRIRPVFWFLLAFVCCSLLLFASTFREHTPAQMQVRLNRAVPIAVGYTTINLHLNDPQNIPIEQAQVVPTARMTNMNMGALSYSVKALGQGNYTIQFALSMGGPWVIKIAAYADGFDALQQSLFIQVPSTLAMGGGVATY
jgi:hypothetical protein